MSTFEKAIPLIMRHEGGWVDDPADPGGETNFGWSMLAIRREGIGAAQLGLPNLEPGALKAMKATTAIELYRSFFWNRYGYGRIDDQRCASKVFDCAVNMGPYRGHVLAQEAAGLAGHSAEVDGILGPLSVAAINACKPEDFLREYAARMATFYRMLISKRPSLAKFESNWLRRAAWVGP